jgi:tRNA nucleotidyltransferase (CCA-adding enzyme)
LCFALLSYRLTATELEYLIVRLRLPKTLYNRLREAHQLKEHLSLLKKPRLAPYRIFQILDKYSQLAIIANLVATDSVTAQRHLNKFNNQLRHIKPFLTGDDLRNMGVTKGPDFKKIFTKLYQARIEGRVITKQDEEYFVEHLMVSH